MCNLLLFLVLVASVCADINFLIAENVEAHHTSAYKLSVPNVLPLRRAQTFVIDFELPAGEVSYVLTPSNDFVLSPIDGVENIVIPYVTGPVTDQWGAWTASATTQIINIPPNAPVGIYGFGISVDGVVKESGTTIVVLFNPWSAEDVVYMPDAAEVQEYVENQDGAMWLSRGSGPMGWTWDQFSEDTFAVSLKLLGELSNFSHRSDVIQVTRAFSALMNANDEGGVLAGRWSEPYLGGKAPWVWTGSGAIFTEFRQNQRSVRWGQCWVFAGILVSAARTLGIPARQITNFDSAHESGDHGPYRLSIDYFSDENGRSIPSLTLGSIWNFHAWTEVWFKRTDISGADGWQVVDATPQELSDGIFQLGPASKIKIKAKDLTVSYDTAFVASEVDAAVRQYAKFNTGKPEHPIRKGYYLAEEQIGACGSFISTKSVGSLNRNDVTEEYKTVNKTTPEHFRPSPKVLIRSKALAAQEIQFKILGPDAVLMGTDLTVQLALTCASCSSSNNRTVKTVNSFEILTYTGKVVGVLQTSSSVTVLADNIPHVVTFSLTREDYQNHLVDGSYIEFHVFAKVSRAGVFTGEFNSQIIRYDIISEPLDVAVHNVTEAGFKLDVAMKNPLSIPLTNAVLTISGAHIQDVIIQIPVIHDSFRYTGIPVKVAGSWSDKHVCYAFVRIYCDEVSFFEGEIVVHEPTW